MNPLGRPEYQPLWAAARRRIETNGLSLEGTPLILKALTADQVDAVAGLLGVRRPAPGAPLRVSLVALDRALRSSSTGKGLVDVLCELGGPVVDRRARTALTAAQRNQQWADLAAHPAVDDGLHRWLDHVRGTGLDRRLAGSDAAGAVRTALDVIAIVNKGSAAHRLPVLAASVTGDAHGLDRGKPAATLAVHALSWLAERPFPEDAADWRRAWSDAGVACDDLSCDVLVLNLPGWASEPLRLTLRQASAWRPSAAPHRVVFVSENPAVLAAAADQLDVRAPTMICLDGMPSTAALVILEALVASGSEVRYHGDFDWRGLAIAAVLARKIAVAQSWRFGAMDYQRAVQRGLGTVALSGRSASSPWDTDLTPVMQRVGFAVYEEQVLDDLLEDIVAVRQSSPHP